MNMTSLRFQHRYHSSEALLKLERYIVGRIAEPWVNLRSSIHLPSTHGGRTTRRRDSPETASYCAALQHRSGADPAVTQQALCRVQLAVQAEEQEQEACLRCSPTLDAGTQQAIARDYRALHEQIKEAGLYRCRYSEYAVELIRCGFLLGAFVYFLRCEWYITSSLFVGMFWVSTRSDLLKYLQKKDRNRYLSIIQKLGLRK